MKAPVKRVGFDYWQTLPLSIYGGVGALDIVLSNRYDYFGWTLATGLILLTVALQAWSQNRYRKFLLITPPNRAAPSQTTPPDLAQAVDALPQTTTNTQPYNPAIEGLDALCQKVLPIWASQVAMARMHTEESIVDLAQRFESLTQRLDAAVITSEKVVGSDIQTGIVELLQNSQLELGIITQALGDSLEAKEKQHHSLEGLFGLTEQLKKMAWKVNHIASQTTLLTGNAALMAALSGEAGHDFFVVAEEVGQLSQASGVIGKEINQIIVTVNKAIEDILINSEKFVRQDKETQANAVRIIASVLSHFKLTAGSLSESEALLRTENNAINQEIYDVFVSLQFQDRVSQILKLVGDDLNKLEQHLHVLNNEEIRAGQSRSINVEQWLEELAKTYTMEEQLTAHNGEKTEFKTHQQTDITFF